MIVGHITFSPCPKNPETAHDARRARVRKRVSNDQAENRIVRTRSKGVCEWPGGCRKFVKGEPHHLEGGYGRRARGPSAWASHKVDLCPDHHRGVTDGKLKLSWDEADPFKTLRVQR